jgi:hypothetical protein
MSAWIVFKLLFVLTVAAIKNTGVTERYSVAIISKLIGRKRKPLKRVANYSFLKIISYDYVRKNPNRIESRIFK